VNTVEKKKKIEDGSSYTSCRPLKKGAAKLPPPYHQTRVIFCGACNRTWFRKKPEIDSWSLVGENEAKKLKAEHEVFEI